jgi:hypothetical protein
MISMDGRSRAICFFLLRQMTLARVRNKARKRAYVTKTRDE